MVFLSFPTYFTISRFNFNRKQIIVMETENVIYQCEFCNKFITVLNMLNVIVCTIIFLYTASLLKFDIIYIKFKY